MEILCCCHRFISYLLPSKAPFLPPPDSKIYRLGETTLFRERGVDPIGRGSYKKVYLASRPEGRVALISARVSEAYLMQHTLIHTAFPEGHPFLDLPPKEIFPAREKIRWCTELALGDLNTIMERVPNQIIFRKICIDLLTGLDYVHSRDYIHGDLKSSNFLLYREFVAKISDWDNCRRVSREKHCLTQTIWFLPPEHRAALQKKRQLPMSDPTSTSVFQGQLLQDSFEGERCSMGLALAHMMFTFELEPRGRMYSLFRRKLCDVIEGLTGYSPWRFDDYIDFQNSFDNGHIRPGDYPPPRDRISLRAAIRALS